MGQNDHSVYYWANGGWNNVDGGGVRIAVDQTSGAPWLVNSAQQIYRRDGDWKFRAVGQGYSSGLAGIARDFGVNLA